MKFTTVQQKVISNLPTYLQCFLRSISLSKDINFETANEIFGSKDLAVQGGLDLVKSQGNDAVIGNQVYLNLQGGFRSQLFGYNPEVFKRPEIEKLLSRLTVNKTAHDDFLPDEITAAITVIYDILLKPNGYSMYTATDGGTSANSDAVSLICNTITYFNEKHGHNIKGQDLIIVGLEGAFHGREMMSGLTHGNQKIKNIPKLGNFQHIPFPQDTEESIAHSIQCLRQLINDNPHKVAGFFMEPIQCEFGDRHVPKGFAIALDELRKEMTQKGMPFFTVYDEVQTGLNSREFLMSKTMGFPPSNIVTLSKRTGVAIIAVDSDIASLEPTAIKVKGAQSSTFRGDTANHVFLALKLLVIEANGLRENIRIRSQEFLDGLKKIKASYPVLIKDVRGIDGILTIEFNSPQLCQKFQEIALDRCHLITLGARNKAIIRLSLTIDIKPEVVHEALNRIQEALQKTITRCKL